jgi:hypothetical protein
MRRFNQFVQVMGITILLAALLQELLRGNERTWHGKLVGIIPYDFRLPTFERVKETFWNPDNPSVFTGQLFGVGWTVNLHTLARLLSRLPNYINP